MRKHSLILLLFFLLLSPILRAEVVTLRTGKTIQGEILLHNEEVVIILTKNGTRFQYPTNDVLSISKEDNDKKKEDKQIDNKHHVRRVNFSFQVSGGAACVPELGWGGQMAADFRIGTMTIQDKRIFLGGAIGYRAKFVNKTTYSFLPLQAVVSMPLIDHMHAPVLGMSIGYGFALNKETQGGICAGTELVWQYTINPQRDFQLGIFAEWQQAKTDVLQNINGIDYINHIGCNFIAMGIKMAMLF